LQLDEEKLKHVNLAHKNDFAPVCVVGPGGLLLVVSHVLAVSVSVLWMGLQKGK
jgi:hypothetical protein